MNDQVITAIIAVVGVPLFLIGYIILIERLVERLPGRMGPRLRPYLWVAPALALAFLFMVLPTISTLILSFQNRTGERFVGLNNYIFFFTNPDTLTALKNNFFWLVFYTGFVLIGGLVIAVLVDRVKYEAIAKTAVFLPLPISAVAASIIWKFMYEYDPPGTTQTGTLNAAIGTFGFQPVAWLVNSATNNGALIFVGIWTATGFAMVIISSSLKAINPELMEAARVDGANEWQVFRMVTTPLLYPTLTVVGTTMIIQALKTFDIVWVLTSGAFDTDVIATQMMSQLLSAGHYGRAAAVGVVLLVAIIPILILNVQRFRQQEEMR